MKKTVKLSAKNLRVIMLLLVVAIFSFANFAARLAVDQFGWKIDLTANSLYEFSPATVRLAGELTSDTLITVFAGREDYPALLTEVIDRYARLSPRISVRYVDPYQNPAVADEYKQQGFTVEPNDLIVAGTKRIKQLKMSELMLMDELGEKVLGLQAEGQLTSALLYVNTEAVPIAKFIDGHNERPTDALFSLFSGSGYETKRIMLSVEELGDADIAVIAAPTRDFEAAEISELEGYMNRGGSAMVFLEPTVASFPNLYGFLSRWNVAVDENIVFEERLYMSDNPINVVPTYAPHVINSYFTDNRYFVVMPRSTSFSLSGADGGAIDASALLVSSPSSYAKPQGSFDSGEKQDADKIGPFSLAVCAEKQTANGEDPARIFAAGSRGMYGDDVLGTASYANSEFLARAIGWCNEQAVSVSIPPKQIAPPPINIFMTESVLWGIFLAVILPGAVLVLGILTVMKRRRL